MPEFDDKELFQSAMSDVPEAPTEAVTTEAESAPVEQKTEVNRDEHGRFAPKEAEAAPVETAPNAQEQAKADEGRVPSWRLREINEAREAAERRASEIEARYRDQERQFAAMRQQWEQQQRPKPEPIDPLIDFDGAMKQTLSPIEQRLQTMQQNMVLAISRAQNLAIHGKDAVNEMEAAVEQASRVGDPSLQMLRAQMLQSDDPVGVAIQWHQQQKLMKETGGDLSSYKSKLLDDALKDPQFLAKAIEFAKTQAGSQAAKPATTVQLPPSIGRATAAASPHDDDSDGSDAALFRFAMR